MAPLPLRIQLHLLPLKGIMKLRVEGIMMLQSHHQIHFNLEWKKWSLMRMIWNHPHLSCKYQAAEILGGVMFQWSTPPHGHRHLLLIIKISKINITIQGTPQQCFQPPQLTSLKLSSNINNPNQERDLPQIQTQTQSKKRWENQRMLGRDQVINHQIHMPKRLHLQFLFPIHPMTWINRTMRKSFQNNNTTTNLRLSLGERRAKRGKGGILLLLLLTLIQAPLILPLLPHLRQVGSSPSLQRR